MVHVDPKEMTGRFPVFARAIEAASDTTLDELMDLCHDEPADFSVRRDGRATCPPCYAYKVMQDRGTG